MATKVGTMERQFYQQLDVCQNELKPAFWDLRNLFFPGNQYREQPSPAEGVEMAQRFKATCEHHLAVLQGGQGRLGSRGEAGGPSAPPSPAAASLCSMRNVHLRSPPRVAQKAQRLTGRSFLGASVIGWKRMPQRTICTRWSVGHLGSAMAGARLGA